MSRPLLQLALDHSSLEAAQRDVTRLKAVSYTHLTLPTT